MDKSAITEIAIRLGWSELWLPFVLLAVLQFLLALLVKTRLEGSIKHDYDKKLEQLRFDVQVRQQAAKIAELMSEARDGGTVLSKEHATKLNKLMWDLSLWLPPQIVRDLTVHICYAKDSKSVQEILVDVRKHILGKPTDDLQPGDIGFFKSNE